MNYWQTTVYGNTQEEIEATAESHIKEFFGFIRDYILDVRPYDNPGFRNVGDSAPKWEADVQVDF